MVVAQTYQSNLDEKGHNALLCPLIPRTSVHHRIDLLKQVRIRCQLYIFMRLENCDVSWVEWVATHIRAFVQEVTSKWQWKLWFCSLMSCRLFW